MNAVRPFDCDRIHELLQRNRLAYTTSADGTCFVEFVDLSEERLPLVVCLLPIAESVLAIRVFLPATYPMTAVPVLLATINRWHSDHQWPRAYVEFDDPAVPDQSGVCVYADTHLDLKPGVHDELLDHLFWTTAHGADEMFRVLHQAVEAAEAHVPTPTAEELNRWLERN